MICLADEAEEGPGLGLRRGPCARPDPCTYFVCGECRDGGPPAGGASEGWKHGRRCAICREGAAGGGGPGADAARAELAETYIGYLALLLNLVLLVALTRQMAIRKSLSYTNLQDIEVARGV